MRNLSRLISLAALTLGLPTSPHRADAAASGFTDFEKLTGTSSLATNPARTPPKANDPVQQAALTAQPANNHAVPPPTMPPVPARTGTNGPAQAPLLNGYIPDDKYKLRVGDRV